LRRTEVRRLSGTSGVTKKSEELLVFHILLAEDNPADLFLIKLALEEHRIPHKLRVVRDGKEALSFVGRMEKSGRLHLLDLLLLDIDVSGVKGVKVVSKWRKRAQRTHTPVIVITSSYAPKAQRRMAALGIDACFLKPHELGAYMNLGEMVRNVVEARSTLPLTRAAGG
jgi:chemotaxis family two-component system response regulator Rcp1